MVSEKTIWDETKRNTRVQKYRKPETKRKKKRKEGETSGSSGKKVSWWGEYRNLELKLGAAKLL